MVFESHSTPEELFESGFFGGSPAPMYKKSGNPWGLPLFVFLTTSLHSGERGVGLVVTSRRRRRHRRRRRRRQCALGARGLR